MLKKAVPIFFVLFLLFLPSVLATEIILRDGKSYKGEIIDDNRSEIYLEQTNGMVVNIEKRKINTIDGEQYELRSPTDALVNVVEGSWVYLTAIVVLLVIFIFLPAKFKLFLIRIVPITILVLAVLVGGVLYFFSSRFLEEGTRFVLDEIMKSGGKAGIEITRFDFTEPKIRSLTSIGWATFSADVMADHEVLFEARDVILALQDLRTRTFSLSAGEVDIFLGPFKEKAVNNSVKVSSRFKGSETEFKFSIEFGPPEEIAKSLRDLSIGVVGFFTKGESPVPITFSARHSFVVKREPVTARIFAAEKGGGSVMKMDREDLKTISDELNESLLDPEIDLLANNPLRTPGLLRIRDHADLFAKRKLTRNPGFPADAYRHVLWSYLLTKAYGEAFAKEVTDAHEAGGSENTEEERQMDLMNNDAGRHYAKAGYEEGSLEKRVLSDRRVIRMIELSPPSTPLVEDAQLTGAEPVTETEPVVTSVDLAEEAEA